MDYGTPEEVLARIVWQARYKDVTCSSRAKALAIHMTDLNLRIGHGKKVGRGAGEAVRRETKDWWTPNFLLLIMLNRVGDEGTHKSFRSDVALGNWRSMCFASFRSRVSHLWPARKPN